MTVDFTQHPLVFYERSETDNKYVFSFEYLKTRDIKVWVSKRDGLIMSSILTPLVEGVNYTITPVSGESGTVTIISVTDPYDYVIIGRYYGYGQEYVMPAAYSGTITQNAVDGLGLQTQQLHARVKDIEDHGVGEGSPDYLTKFDIDGHTLKEAEVSNPSGTVNVHVPMNTGNIASTGNISASTLDVSGSATAGTMTVSASTSSGSLTVSGTSTLQDTSVKNLTLAEYLFTSNYRLFWQLENVEENQIMHFIKGAYTSPEDWAIANVNIDDVLGVRGTPNTLAKFNPTGKNVVDSRVIDTGAGAVTFSAPIETEGAAIISSDPVLTYSTGTTQTGFSVIPTSSFTKVAIYAETIKPSRLLSVADTSASVATLEFTDPPVSNVKPSTTDFVAYYDTDTTVSGKAGLIVTIPAPTEVDYVLKANVDGTANWQELVAPISNVKPSTVNFVTYYDTDTTVSGKAGLVPGIPEATDAGYVLTAAGDGTADWHAPTGGGSGTVGPGIVGEYALFDSPNTITSRAGLLPPIPLAAEVDYVLRANDDGTANWEALGTLVSSVKPSTTGYVAYYDTDTTVSGQSGLIPSIPLSTDTGFVLTASDDGTASWQVSSGGSITLKPGGMFATRNKSAITEQNGKLYESSSGYEVVRCDGQTLSYNDYSDILEHANMDVTTVPGELPPPESPIDFYAWRQLELEDGEGRFTIASAFGTKYNPGSEPDHFYVAQTYDKPHTLTKVYKVYSANLDIVKVQEITYVETDTGNTFGHQGAYCYGKYYVLAYFTDKCNIEIYSAIDNSLLYTHEHTAPQFLKAQINFEILEDDGLLIGYGGQINSASCCMGLQHVLYDGNATFTPQPIVVTNLTGGSPTFMNVRVYTVTNGDRAEVYACFNRVYGTSSPYLYCYRYYYILSTPTIAPVLLNGKNVYTYQQGATGITAYDDVTGYFPAHTNNSVGPACVYLTSTAITVANYTGGEIANVVGNRMGGFNLYRPNEAIYFDDETVYYSTTGGKDVGGNWIRSLTGIDYTSCQVIASYFPVKYIMCTSGSYAAQTGTLAPMHVFYQAPVPAGILAPKLKEHYLVTANKLSSPLTDRVKDREEVRP